VARRERGSEKSRILYKGHDLRPGEEILWLSNRKAEHLVSLGQFVVTNERLMFEPLRMIGAHGRRWEMDLADVNHVELNPPPKRPWPTRGKLRLSFRDGKTTEFMFAPDGWFPRSADRDAALQEAYDEIKAAAPPA
jgi:hypothetical protein